MSRFSALWVVLLLCLWAASGGLCSAEQSPEPARYISVDEVRPGMEAYCLTVFKGTEVEKFSLEVVSVIHNFRPGLDAILVRGTDERFIQAGAVAGCSGSPVYIDGRLAGALAFAWTYSKEPIYGVTPIADMLRVGTGKPYQTAWADQADIGVAIDLSTPVDLDRAAEQFNAALTERADYGALTAIPAPLIVSGLPAPAFEQLRAIAEPLGLMPVAGGGTSTEQSAEDTELSAGSTLVLPLVSGDIQMSVLGTVTEVVGDRVYGFGHYFLGYGPVDIPMATGRIHTVVSSMVRSFKLGSPGKIVGAVRADEATAIQGRLGAEAKTIPLTVRVDRYNDVRSRQYNCRVVDNRLLTPTLVPSVVSGAALMLGSLPPDHTIRYDVTIGIADDKPVSYSNISTGIGLAELTREVNGTLALLMNNPYRKVAVTSLDCYVRLIPKSVIAHIWSAELSDSTVKPGDQVDIDVVLESVLAEKKRYHYSLKVPEDLRLGKYDLTIVGWRGYYDFLRKNAPYRFTAQNLDSLIESIRNILGVRRDRLYCILSLPAGGIAVERAELPDLPATRALVLQDAKRTISAQPYRHWFEKSIRTGMVVADRKVMKITVER